MYVSLMYCSGAPTILHRLISDGKVDMGRNEHCDRKFITDTALACGISTSGKSKVRSLPFTLKKKIGGGRLSVMGGGTYIHVHIL